MHCFWIFPLFCAVAGAFIVPISQWQALLPLELEPQAWLQTDVYYTFVNQSTNISWPSAWIGGAFGLFAAAWNGKRNRFVDESVWSSTRRWLLNGFWCAFFCSLFILSGALVTALVQWKTVEPRYHVDWESSPLYLFQNAIAHVPLLANSFALVWATVQTITQTDVLTPRVLWQKLKRSSTLESRAH